MKIVIIDEYQDTNFIQTKIYFEFARIALQNGGSLSVVGDDDQSIYRFRGATVELFRNFPDHFSNQLQQKPRIIKLRDNYRSTENIVDFINKYIQLDHDFQNVRVINKLPIKSSREKTTYNNYPIFGLFRDDLDDLAHDLADFINSLYVHNSKIIKEGEIEHKIQLNSTNGSAADLCVLCSSAKERDYNDDPRLPLLLKNELEKLNPKIKVFNPSGKKLSQIPEIMKLCGLILECIDPSSTIQDEIQNFPHKARSSFDEWRNEAQRFIVSNPPALRNVALREFVNCWQQRKKRGNNEPITEQNVSLIDLSYNLVTWIPFLMEDIEGLAYFESILRTMEDNILFSDYKSEILVDAAVPFSRYQKATIREAYWNIFVPIALGAIEIEEDLFETLPHDRLNIMSIHQAKGLEFPLVIVDVGSEFKGIHKNHAFKRHPVEPSFDTIVETELRPFSQLEHQLHIDSQSPRTIDRDFDELIRKFFVAYSRSQDILLIIGLNSVRDGYTLKKGERREIMNIATGWDREGLWVWGSGLHNLTHIRR
jgi:DNA helicase-2/ATP-dependent DNA helicase PcrA